MPTPAGHAAEQKLEFWARHRVAVEPRALALLGGANLQELRAVPVALEGGIPVLAVAAPTEERLASVRSAAGEAARFVLVDEDTLDALLASRLLQPAAPPHGTTAEPAVTPSAAVQEAPAAPRNLPPDAEAPIEAPAPAREPVRGDEAERAADRPDGSLATFESLLEEIDTAASAVARLRASAALLANDAHEAKREARAAKAELAAALAANDQLERAAQALETELTETRAVLEDTRERLTGITDSIAAASTRSPAAPAAGGWKGT